MAEIAALGPDNGWHLERKPDPRYTWNGVHWDFLYKPTPDAFGNIAPVNPLIGLPLGWKPDPFTTAVQGTLSKIFGQGYLQSKANPPTISRLSAPNWYPLRPLLASGPAIVNLNPYPGTASPVMVYLVQTPAGPMYLVPGWWLLNEGWQSLPPATAREFGGYPLGGELRIINHTPPTDSRGYLFAYNPGMFLPTGLASGAYQPGQNVGKENWQGAIMAVAFIGVFVGGAVLLGASVGAAGAGAGAAGVGAADADLYAVAAGADALTTGATGGIEAATLAQGGILASADLYAVAPGATALVGNAPVVAGTVVQGGILGTGITLPTLGELGTTALKTGLAAGLGKITQKLQPTPKPKITASPVQSAGGAPFTSTLTGQLLVAIVGGLAVVLLARKLL